MEPRGSVPVPDPTAATTASLQRESSALKELLLQRITAVEQGIQIAHENLVRVPTDVDKAISHLREVVEAKLDTVQEKFAGIATQFRERDTRVDQTAALAKQALDAALQAAKELVGTQSASFVASIEKSDASTEKRFDALQLTIAAVTTGVTDKIDDLKDRLTLLEGTDRGKTVAVVEKQASSTSMINVAAMLAGWAIAAAALISLFSVVHK